jgi:carboxyl-terminal processing protease
MSQRARLVLALSIGLVLGLSLSVTDRVLADRSPAEPAQLVRMLGPTTMPWKDARLLAEVMQRVKDNYVDPVSDHQLLQNAIRGMVEALDDHSTFLSPDEFDDMKVSTSGAYAGIGVEVAPGKEGVEVVHRMEGSPAQRAGVETGDIIISIDGVAVDPSDLDGAIARMRGPEGSTIRLVVRRAGSATPLEFQVERAHVQLRSVSGDAHQRNRLSAHHELHRYHGDGARTPGGQAGAGARAEGPGVRDRSAQQSWRCARCRCADCG